MGLVIFVVIMIIAAWMASKAHDQRNKERAPLAAVLQSIHDAGEEQRRKASESKAESV